MNKTILAIVIVAIVVAGGYLFFKGGYQLTPSVPQTSHQQTAPQPSTSASSTRQPLSQPSAGHAPVAGEKAVTYTDAGYSPATLQIKKGETVIFRNQSSRSMWTASALHPTHRVYPTTGGCLGSTFDACKGIQPADSWSFKFDITGTWKYHNHVSPSDTGAIIVVQ